MQVGGVNFSACHRHPTILKVGGELGRTDEELNQSCHALCGLDIKHCSQR